MLDIINPYLAGPAVEGFFKLRMVFGQRLNGPGNAPGIFAGLYLRSKQKLQAFFDRRTDILAQSAVLRRQKSEGGEQPFQPDGRGGGATVRGKSAFSDQAVVRQRPGFQNAFTNLNGVAFDRLLRQGLSTTTVKRQQPGRCQQGPVVGFDLRLARPHTSQIRDGVCRRLQPG